MHGTPAPQGSKRGFAVKGRVVMVESSAKVKPWRQDVAVAAREAAGALALPVFPAGTPLLIEVTFTLRKPASAPKRKRTWPATRPDLDKLVRSTLDGLSGVAWYDDSQVVEVAAAKRYPSEGVDALSVPGALIRIRGLAS